MEELFYSSGKIYVVIGVVTIILTGIFVYLFWIDRKVSRMEKEINDNAKK
jgi:CcmD family protein